MQKSPHANTHPARGLADSPHVVWLHPGKPLGPVRDRREGCSAVAGSSWKRTRLRQRSAKPINGAGRLHLHTVINNKWSPKEERPRMGSLASAGRCKAHPSVPAGQGPLTHCPWVASAPAVGPEGKTPREGEGCKAPFEAQSSAFRHHLRLLCQDGEPVTHVLI